MSATVLTLTDLWVDRSSRLANATLVVGGALFTALCAQIVLPLGPVPFTMQTFAVLCCGFLLGARRGALSQATYLLMGGAGLPFFAGANGGMLRLLGPTGGYLVGFVLAAALIGWLAERRWDRTPLWTALAALSGYAVIYALGVTWLATYLGWQQAFASGVLPFLPVAAGKIALAMACLPLAWKVTGRR